MQTRNAIKRVTVLMEDNSRFDFVIGQPASLDLKFNHSMGVDDSGWVAPVLIPGGQLELKASYLDASRIERAAWHWAGRPGQTKR